MNGLRTGAVFFFAAAAVASASVLMNDSFEQAGSSALTASYWEWANPEGWFQGSFSGAAQRSSEQAYSGSWSMAFRGTGAGLGNTANVWQSTDSGYPQAGRVYALSLKVWSDEEFTATSLQLRLEFWNREGEVYSLLHQEIQSFSAPGEHWTTISLNGIAPLNTTYLSVNVDGSGFGASGSLMLDDIELGESIPEPVTAILIPVGMLIFIIGRRRYAAQYRGADHR